MAGKMRSLWIDYDYMNQYQKKAISGLASLETGIHKINTGGPIFHCIMFRYNEEYYSAILVSYDNSSSELPIFVKYASGDLFVRFLN